MEKVILVNEHDEQVGTMEKMEAHEKGILHRAFSVFVFNDNDDLLMQQRAVSKYHSGGLWTNTCCSHPREGEAAIIFSLEGVFATIAAWFLLNQILGANNLLGCFFILCGVLLSQLLPLIKQSV